MMMDVKPKASLHNEFDIHVRDVVTGEVTKYKAYNIVLNNLLNHLVSRNSTNVGSIHIGDGTGTIEATRTTLFNGVRIRGFSHVDRGWTAAQLEGWERKKMTIIPAEDVGVTFTEVGLGTTSASGLMTHAFIEDSEGNPISIGPKTDTEEITFYATWYYKLLGNGVDGMVYVGDPAPSTANISQHNALTAHMRQLYNGGFSGGGTIMSSIRASIGRSRKPTKALIDGEMQNSRVYQGISPTKTISGSTHGYTRKFDGTTRYESGEGNGPIFEICYELHSSEHATPNLPLCRIMIKDLPASIWEGIEFVDQELGTGDGAETGFDTAHMMIEDVAVKVDGTTVTNYTLFPYPSGTTIDYHHIPSWGALVKQESGSTSNIQELFDGLTGVSHLTNFHSSDSLSIDLIESKRWGIGAMSGRHAWSSTSQQGQNMDVHISNDGETWTLVAEGLNMSTGSTGWSAQEDFDTIPTEEFRYIKLTAHLAWRVEEVRFHTRAKQIIFDAPVSSGNAVTATYKVKEYIPKASDLLLDMSGPSITYGHENPV